MIQEQLFFEQEIIRIQEEYGIQYFFKSVFHASLKDLSSQIERKYFAVLKFADDFRLYKKIRGNAATDVSTEVTAIENLQQQFIDYIGLDASIANEVFWVFLYGKIQIAIRLSNTVNFRELDSDCEDNKISKISSENIVESIKAKKARIEENVETRTIGDQEWMKSNLSIIQFVNGESNPLVRSSDEVKVRALEKQAVFCYYKNDERNLNQHRLLYNWWVISDERGIAPAGYWEPKKVDFELLRKITRKNCKLLKFNPIWNGNNVFEFSAIPAGFRSKFDKFKELRSEFYFWNFTNIFENTATCLALLSYISSITDAIDQMYY